MQLSSSASLRIVTDALTRHLYTAVESNAMSPMGCQKDSTKGEVDLSPQAEHGFEELALVEAVATDGSGVHGT